MDKQIGFKRNIHLIWMEQAARLCIMTDDPTVIRRELDAFVGQQLKSSENRRMTISILLSVWLNTRHRHPLLYDEARKLYIETTNTSDHLWLHYGLALLAYPFFREVTHIVGQMSRLGEDIRSAKVTAQLMASKGSLGSLGKAVQRVIFSLRDWGMLINAAQRNAYSPRQPRLRASTAHLEMWLLACALDASPAEEIPFQDLVRLPELFPFEFTVGVTMLRESSKFEIQRSGGGWTVVRRRELT